MDIARAQCKGNGMAVKKEVFVQTKADNCLAKLHRHAFTKTPSSLRKSEGF